MKWENENEMHYNAYTAFCQNCVLGLQWNMKISRKLKKQQQQQQQQPNKQKTRNDWQIKDMN